MNLILLSNVDNVPKVSPVMLFFTFNVISKNKTTLISFFSLASSLIISASVDGNVLSFESDKFSTYALAYEDVKDEVIVNPPTGDKIVLDLVVGIVSVAGLGLVAKSIAKRKKYFN